MQQPVDERRLQDLTAREYEGLAQTTLRASDGTTLQVYDCGPADAPPLIVVNPIGIPILLVTRLIRRLAANYRITCWLQRGIVSPPDAAHPNGAFDTMVDDLLNVVQSRDAQSAPMIGVCSGASLLVRATARKLIDPEHLVLVSPLIRFTKGYVASQFEATVVPYMRTIARGNRGLAQTLIQLSQKEPHQQSGSEDLLLVQNADRANLQSVESLLSYAAIVDSFMAQQFDADIPELKGQISIVSAAGDKMIDSASVRRLAALIPQATLTEFSEGGHYAIFVDARARDEIADKLIAAGTL